MEKREPLVRMVKISKNFGKVQALKEVDFEVGCRQIIGLVGDNGAGKSTLIKILTGVFPPDGGEVYFEGKRIFLKSPREARDLGIETVHQHLALIDLMSVTRNVFLGREVVQKFLGMVPVLDMRKMKKIAEESLLDLGIKMRSVDEKISNLSGGQRQAVAIGRAVYFGAKLLILDEPTAALSIRECHKVLDHILEAKEKGLSVIFITHNIYHVYSVADRFTILDHGVKLGDFSREEVTAEDVIEMVRTGQVKGEVCNG
ncbi:MAG: ATP-binding cassette domain-containing protein [Candidatus Caldatribacteriaceae bacterium]